MTKRQTFTLAAPAVAQQLKQENFHVGGDVFVALQRVNQRSPQLTFHYFLGAMSLLYAATMQVEGHA